METYSDSCTTISSLDVHKIVSSETHLFRRLQSYRLVEEPPGQASMHMLSTMVSEKYADIKNMHLR